MIFHIFADVGVSRLVARAVFGDVGVIIIIIIIIVISIIHRSSFLAC